MSNPSPSPSELYVIAADLVTTHTKAELVGIARSEGWRGDHARAPILQLALYIAQVRSSGGHRSPDDMPAPSSQSSQSGQSGESGERSDAQESPGKGSESTPEPSNGDGNGDGAGKGENVPEDDFVPSPVPEGLPDHIREALEKWNADQSAKAAAAKAEREQREAMEREQREAMEREQREAMERKQREAMEREQEQAQREQSRDEGGQSPEARQEPEEPAEQDPDTLAAEYRELLKHSGIVDAHPLLQKVWRLSAKAGINVLLIGPAGAGKTMLAEQLGQLLTVPFSSVSCTMGMSESQLTGWLLPVGDNGRFSYVAAPFVDCLQKPSVFLLDELDAADPNVLLMANSVLSNGFITVPHKLENPTIRRDTRAIIIGGANTTGSGGDDIYSAREALDGATIDRFYPIAVDYSKAYETSIFTLGPKKAKRREASFESAPAVTADELENIGKWFFNLRAGVRKSGLRKIVSTRLAQRIVAARKVGISFEEIQEDILLGWSKDDMRRAGV